eukprot:GHRQ01026886.1.p1 GENE.GHRQ01026886.1~~GHRQ01026886.1.p1  ORF type:complete len:114 (+),score=19.88 GHRQ01026886.1:393-734(+)
MPLITRGYVHHCTKLCQQGHCFSHVSRALVQILEAEKLGGGLALSIAVMYEASLGQASKWCAAGCWLQTLLESQQHSRACRLPVDFFILESSNDSFMHTDNPRVHASAVQPTA